MSRHQRTIYLDGCRVRLSWRLPSGRARLRVTDPNGDAELEMAVAAKVAGHLAEMFVRNGIGLKVGPVIHVDDHR